MRCWRRWNRFRKRSRSQWVETKGLTRSVSWPNADMLGVVPQVAQNLGRKGGSAIDQRTTRHSGDAVSQKKRKRIEECFGWLKTIALMRKLRHRGVCKADWIFAFGCPPTTWCACGN